MAETHFGEGPVDPNVLKLKRVVAEQVRFSLAWRMPANWDVVTQHFDYGLRIGVAFNMFLLGCEIRRDVEKRESVPTGLWSHILLRLPQLRCIFGIPKMREIPTVVKHWHVCPHIRTDPQQRHVEFLYHEELSP